MGEHGFVVEAISTFSKITLTQFGSLGHRDNEKGGRWAQITAKGAFSNWRIESVSPYLFFHFYFSVFWRVNWLILE